MIKSLPNLYSFLGLPEKELHTIISTLQHHYSLKIKPKIKYGEFQRDDSGKIKYRTLMVPDYILKSRQQRISRLLNKIILPDYMFGSIKEKNNIQNAQQHLNHKYFFTIDLKNYFTNISHHQVNKVFNKTGFSPSVSRILTQLTTYQGSLPQGVPSSPVIANLVFLDVGNELHMLAKNNHLTFTAFLDDLTFSSNNDFKNIIPQIIDIIKRNNFFIAHKKIHYRTNFCEVTGLFVKGKILELPYLMQKKTATNYKLRVYQNQVRSYNLINSSVLNSK